MSYRTIKNVRIAVGTVGFIASFINIFIHEEKLGWITATLFSFSYLIEVISNE